MRNPHSCGAEDAVSTRHCCKSAGADGEAIDGAVHQAPLEASSGPAPCSGGHSRPPLRRGVERRQQCVAGAQAAVDHCQGLRLPRPGGQVRARTAANRCRPQSCEDYAIAFEAQFLTHNQGNNALQDSCLAAWGNAMELSGYL